MAKKPTEQPSKLKDHLRSIAMAIGLIGFGVSVTYIIMSQATPLREELRESKKKCSELLKENEGHQKQIEEIKMSTKSLINDNAKLNSIIEQKNKEYDKLKVQLSQAISENKTLSTKLIDLQRDYNNLYNTLKSKENEMAEYWRRQYSKFRRDKIDNNGGSLPKENIKTKEKKPISLNSTETFINDEIFISLHYANNKEGKVNAVVSSSGYAEMKIDNGVVNKAYYYKTNKSYEIRVMEIGGNIAIFLVKVN